MPGVNPLIRAQVAERSTSMLVAPAGTASGAPRAHERRQAAMTTAARKRIVLPIVVLLSVFVTPSQAAPAPARWTTFSAEQHLTTGRFAVRSHIANAQCLGTGKGAGPSYDRTFRTFECKVFDKGYETERQLALRVTGETTFAVRWITGGPCG